MLKDEENLFNRYCLNCLRRTGLEVQFNNGYHFQLVQEHSSTGNRIQKWFDTQTVSIDLSFQKSFFVKSGPDFSAMCDGSR